MGGVKGRPLGPAAAGYIADNLRLVDRIECQAMGMEPKFALGMAVMDAALGDKRKGMAYEVYSPYDPCGLTLSDGQMFISPPEAARRTPRGYTKRVSPEASPQGLTPKATVEGKTLGVVGWTGDSIWSLWLPLGLAEAKEIVRLTPMVVAFMVRSSGHIHLGNQFLASNKVVHKWLLGSKCFDIGEEVSHNGYSLVPFLTKPLEELQRLCAGVK